MRNFLFKSAVLFLGVFFLSGCDERPQKPAESSLTVDASATPEFSQPRRQRIVRGVYSDLFLNPQQASNIDQVAFLRDLFEGLVIYDTKGNIVPAVAENWQTQDNKTWQFTLRETAKWSNGEPVTAQQFVASWQALAKSNSPLKNYLAYMNLLNAGKVLKQELPPEALGIVAENDRTLRLTLDKPTPYLPHMLAHSSLLPQYLQPHEGIVSNGAYQVSGQQGELIHLEQNPHYWAKEKVSFKNVDYQKITAKQEVSA